MRCLLSYDLVGLQTRWDVGNFERSLQELKGKIADRDKVDEWWILPCSVGAFPIGIVVDAFAAMARTEEAEARIERLNRRASARIHIIGVDRLDYTKGLPERLRSFRRLLELYPENQKVATLMQIAPPTREDVDAYADIRHELEALSGPSTVSLAISTGRRSAIFTGLCRAKPWRHSSAAVMWVS